jgi:hypothetical protein
MMHAATVAGQVKNQSGSIQVPRSILRSACMCHRRACVTGAPAAKYLASDAVQALSGPVV